LRQVKPFFISTPKDRVLGNTALIKALFGKKVLALAMRKGFFGNNA